MIIRVFRLLDLVYEMVTLIITFPMKSEFEEVVDKGTRALKK